MVPNNVEGWLGDRSSLGCSEGLMKFSGDWISYHENGLFIKQRSLNSFWGGGNTRIWTPGFEFHRQVSTTAAIPPAVFALLTFYIGS